LTGQRTRKENNVKERKVVEKRTEIEREDPVVEGVKNVNIGPDGTAQVQESGGDVVDDPVGATTVRKETTIEERRSS